MNRESLIRGISASWRTATLLHLEETFANPAPLNVEDDFRQAAMSEDTLYEDLYLLGLRTSFYNFLLSDFSYFQFSVNDEGESRFAYYPNPFIGASQAVMQELAEMREYVVEEIITPEDYLHAVSERRVSQHPPLVRYEYAPSQYVELKHPCSHFHFGHHSDNRWAVKRELTPQAFSLLIYRQFYSSNWTEFGAGNPIGGIAPLDEQFRIERQNSQMIGDLHFSARESLNFHFI